MKEESAEVTLLKWMALAAEEGLVLGEFLSLCLLNMEYSKATQGVDLPGWVKLAKREIEELDEAVAGGDLDEVDKEVADVLQNAIFILMKHCRMNERSPMAIFDLARAKFKKRKPFIFERRSVPLQEEVALWEAAKGRRNDFQVAVDDQGRESVVIDTGPSTTMLSLLDEEGARLLFKAISADSTIEFKFPEQFWASFGLEIYEGQLRLLVWEPGQGECTHTIPIRLPPRVTCCGTWAAYHSWDSVLDYAVFKCGVCQRKFMPHDDPSTNKDQNP